MIRTTLAMFSPILLINFVLVAYDPVRVKLMDWYFEVPELHVLLAVLTITIGVSGWVYKQCLT